MWAFVDMNKLQMSTEYRHSCAAEALLYSAWSEPKASRKKSKTRGDVQKTAKNAKQYTAHIYAKSV